ncbi:universal stress protein [Guyparkeria halopsychrophila]|uniref:universal stress protein n=1 Tax=Guyparkeria halopsychrophila TaxID=3139421 RepID=UPI0037CA780F
MTEPHVLLLIDASPTSRSALASAARLARHQHCELVALFIEEQDLHASAGHPFTREISALSGESRPFDREILLIRLAQQRRQIEMLMASLDRQDRQDRLGWRLDVVSGPVIDNIRQAALGAEWVVLGKAGWSASRGGRLGSTARQIVETTRSRLLLWQEDAFATQGAIVALVHDSGDCGPGIETARLLALATDRNVRLLLLPDVDPASLPALASWQQQEAPQVTVERLSAHSIEALHRTLKAPPAGALVIDDRGASLLGLPMADLIAQIDIPIIRAPAPAEPA